MVELPTGAVTFMFTDMEGSTRLLESSGEEAFRRRLDHHHRVLREAISAHRGVEVHTVGDSFFMVFRDAQDALAAALAAQRALARGESADGGRTRVRIGLHTGEARLGGDDYVGLAVHQAARVSAAAHGEQVVVTAATRDAARGLPGGCSLRSLGRHRLKDLGAPVELFQLCHPDLPAEHPPLRSLESVGHNLPVQLSSFLGRSEELVEGGHLLARTRLLSVVGPGGTGKTRLAYQLAAEHLHQYPDGVWVAELAAVSDPAMLPSALMEAIGLREERGHDAADSVTAHLRGRHALVLLDNCEHLVAAISELVEALLRAAPRVTVMATSREPLRVAGETVWAVRPLVVPSGEGADIAELARADAVRLFCERAAEARAGFALTPDNAAAVLHICQRLEGIPLAIELAAARVRTLPLAQIVERLERSLDLLSRGVRGAVLRQASLRGAIDWSHGLLSTPEQKLLRRLSVFAGTFNQAAAEAVGMGEGLAADHVADVLESLVDKSLVALGEDRAAEGRYGMLETIRAYAMERLEAAGEHSEASARHAAYYRGLVHDLAPLADRAAGLQRLEADHPNILAALEHLAASKGADRATRGQMLVDLSLFWYTRGYWQLARREFSKFLERPGDDALTAAYCHRHLARVLFSMGDSDSALEHFESALKVAVDLGDRALESEAIGGIAGCAYVRGAYEAARSGFEQALDISRELGDERNAGRWVGNLGHVAFAAGDRETERACYEQALASAREVGDLQLEGNWTGNLGNVAWGAGDSALARERYGHALQIALELGDRQMESNWHACIGHVEWSSGGYAAAATRYETALRLARRVGDRSLEGRRLSELGTVAWAVGDYSGSQGYFESALRLAQDLGDRRLLGQCMGALGEVLHRSGRLEEATRVFDQALPVLREVGDRYRERQAVGGLGEVALARGDLAAARRRYLEMLELAAQIEDEDGEVLEMAAGLLASLGSSQEAARVLGAAEARRDPGDRSRTVSEQARCDALVEQCRASLGEGEFRAALAAGGQLTWAAAAEAAVSLIRLPGAPPGEHE